jgi:O-antigen/teichoic acid export membrane protein
MTVPSSDTAAVRAPLKPLSLRRSFSWTLVANGITALCNVAILSALAKLGSAAIVGQYTLGVTLGTMIHALPQLSLRAVQSTDARDRFLFREYLGLRLIGVVVGCAAVAAAALLGGYRPDTALVVVLVGVYMGVTGVSDIVYGLLQRYEQHNRMAVSMIIKAVLSVIVVAAVMAATHQVALACIALIVSTAVVCAWYDFPAARFVLTAHPGHEAAPPERLQHAMTPSFDCRRMASLAWLSLPLGIANGLNLIYFYAARLVIVRYHGEADLGIFSASAQLAAGGYLVTSALAMATGPRMAHLYVQRRWDAFSAVLGKFLGVSTVLGVLTLLAGALLGGPLLRVVYTPEYARQPAVLLWLLGAAAINYVATCFGTSLTVSRQFNVQLALGLVSVATTVLVSLWLVPRIGLVGGGIAAAATSAIRLIGLAAVFVSSFARARRGATLDPAPETPVEVGEGPA